MNRKRTLPISLLLIVAASSLAGCITDRITDFTLISTKNSLLLNYAEKDDQRISGEDCTMIFLGVPNMKEAIDDAIEVAGPEYDALVDGVVTLEDRFLYQCYVVEGTPIAAKKQSVAEKSMGAAPSSSEHVRPGRSAPTVRARPARPAEAPARRSPATRSPATREPAKPSDIIRERTDDGISDSPRDSTEIIETAPQQE